jgi:hypothetical protein
MVVDVDPPAPVMSPPAPVVVTPAAPLVPDPVVDAPVAAVPVDVDAVELVPVPAVPAGVPLESDPQSSKNAPTAKATHLTHQAIVRGLRCSSASRRFKFFTPKQV